VEKRGRERDCTLGTNEEEALGMRCRIADFETGPSGIFEKLKAFSLFAAVGK